jgi:hypothetical protein
VSNPDVLDTQAAASQEAFRVVLIVAIVVSVLFAAPALLIAVKVLWLGALMLAADVAVFALMYKLARRYWIGLLFVSPLIYVVISTVVFAVALQLPAFEVITRIQ